MAQALQPLSGGEGLTALGEPNDSKEITVSASAAPAHSREVAGLYMNDAPVEGDTGADDQLIARVLRRAHLKATARNEPNEARAILDVAQSFADELFSRDDRFDRSRFIEAATDQS